MKHSNVIDINEFTFKKMRKCVQDMSQFVIQGFKAELIQPANFYNMGVILAHCSCQFMRHALKHMPPSAQRNEAAEVALEVYETCKKGIVDGF